MDELQVLRTRVGEMAAEVERLQSVIDEANAQPVCEVVQLNQDRYLSLVCVGAVRPKVGDKLYARPIPAQQSKEHRGTNEYGLDVGYMAGKLNIFLRDIDRHTPDELHKRFMDTSVDRNLLQGVISELQSPALAVPSNSDLDGVENDIKNHAEKAPLYPIDAERLKNACLRLIAEVRRLRAIPPCTTEPAVSVPDGWKLVPIVLTDEMVEAFNIAEDSFQDGRGTAPDCHWAAMISAAPLPTSGQSPRITEQELREWLGVTIGLLDDYVPNPKPFTDIGRALLDKLNATSPTPSSPAQQS